MTKNNIYHTVEVIEQKTYYSLEEICIVTALNEKRIRELLDYGVIQTEDDKDIFNDSQLDLIMKAHRLQRDLELNLAGVALAMQLLDTIEQQEQELAKLRYENQIISE